MIPGNYFYFWTGQDFQYAHFLSVCSLLSYCTVETLRIYVEDVPQNNRYWGEVQKLDAVEVKPVCFRQLTRSAGYHFSDFAAFLSNSNRNHRSDLIRYLLLAADGGIYLDFDTLVVKDLKPLLDVDFFVGRQREDYWGNDINGAIMGSKKNGTDIRGCIDAIRNFRKADKISTLKDLEVVLNRWFLPKKYRWAEVGPALLTRHVRTKEFLGKVYPVEYFQYWHHDKWHEIFAPGQLDHRTFVIHYFGSRSMMETGKINEDTIWHHDSVYGQAVRTILRSQSNEVES